MGKYNIGEVWWTQFPFKELDESKRRPAIVIDEKNNSCFSYDGHKSGENGSL